MKKSIIGAIMATLCGVYFIIEVLSIRYDYEFLVDYSGYLSILIAVLLVVYFDKDQKEKSKLYQRDEKD